MSVLFKKVMRGEDEVICYFGPGKAWVLGVGGRG